jgi:hypothetical protein
MLRAASLCLFLVVSACGAQRHDEAISVLEVEESFGPSCGEACVVVVLTPSADIPPWPLERANIFAETARLSVSSGAYVSGEIISRPNEASGAYGDDIWAVRFSCPLRFVDEGAPHHVDRAAQVEINVTGLWRAVSLQTVIDVNRLNQVCARQTQ